MVQFVWGWWEQEEDLQWDSKSFFVCRHSKESAEEEEDGKGPSNSLLFHISSRPQLKSHKSDQAKWLSIVSLHAIRISLYPRLGLLLKVIEDNCEWEKNSPWGFNIVVVGWMSWTWLRERIGAIISFLFFFFSSHWKQMFQNNLVAALVNKERRKKVFAFLHSQFTSRLRWKYMHTRDIRHIYSTMNGEE